MLKHIKRGDSEYSLEELINWVKGSLNHGHTFNTAKDRLINHGCDKEKVEKAIKKVKTKKLLRKIIIITATIIIIAAIGLFSYYFFFKEKPELSPDMETFKKYMKECARAEYFNEEESASWYFEIIKKQKDTCIIKVKLLQAKEGELGLVKLEGQSMQCSYPLGFVTTPGNELKECTGKLKESLQEIIIEKLHTHVIENLGSIDKTLNT